MAGDAGGPSIELLLSDLAPDVIERLEALEDPPLSRLSAEEVLEAIRLLDQPFTVSNAGLTCLTDSRWHLTLPSTEPGAPLMELRRWPGDSVLAFYALAGASGPDGPPIPGGPLRRIGELAGGVSGWSVRVETPSGVREGTWLERAVSEGSSHLGALLLPGDGGLGEAGVAARMVELRSVFERVEIQPALWKLQKGLDPGGTLRLPATAVTPGPKSEEVDPWQVARATGFTVGLPPGLRTQRLDAGLPSALDLPGGQLWIRGSFVDQSGAAVTIGDSRHAGYVAEVAAPTESWVAGEQPPLGVTRGSRLAAESYRLAVDRTGAQEASAERWRSPDFQGEWLVFRLRLPRRGIEIGLPVMQGRRSQSLFWIPVTWRDAGRPPAPPPVDPAARFGIRFDRLTRVERQRRPWTEGVLEVPGMHAEIPQGWFPAASLRTSDGYPVRVFDETGKEVATLERLSPEQWRQATGAAGWEPVKKRGGAAAIHRHADGSYLFASKEGHAYRWSWNGEGEAQGQLWSMLVHSVQVLRSRPGS